MVHQIPAIPQQQQLYHPQPQQPILQPQLQQGVISSIFESLSPFLPSPSPQPPAALFRHKTVKAVELTVQGNYIVDIPVPEKILAIINRNPLGTSAGSPSKPAVYPQRREWRSSDTVVDVSDEVNVSTGGTDDASRGGEAHDANAMWSQIQGAAAVFFGSSVSGAGRQTPEIEVEQPASRTANAVVTPSIVDTSREFTHLRYTAATCDPNDFKERGYRLRSQDLDRKTELFIVITMYNENEHLFTKTWKAVMRNISHLCSKRRSKVWGPDGWKKIVVCVVADGREKIHKRTLTVLGIMGAYQDGIIKTSVNNVPTTAHIFEYTTQVMVEPNGEQTVKGPAAFKMNEAFGGVGLPPVQVLFCLKERNAKKINSHRWFFNAFGRLLKPEVCILLDVGTKPTDRSIYHLWKAFHRNQNVGGACGEIYAELGVGWSKLWNPLVAAQNFEYKISNILDKPFESCFGFISVLPGAFSAYRYKALQNDDNGVGPLEKYFMGETLHDGGDISKANMYLAEDRILCFELVSKRGQAWVLKYVRRAKAETDVPDTVPEFISQRRRWLNGSFFAGVHALVNCHQILTRSNHPLGRKFLFMFQSFYNLVNLLFNWFSLGNMYLIFVFLVGSVVNNPAADPFGGYGRVVFIAMRQLYLYALLLVFLSSLGNRPQGSKALYLGCFVLFAAIMGLLLYITACSLVQTIPRTEEQWAADFSSVSQGPIVMNLLLSLGSTYGVYFLASFLFLDPWHLFTSMVQYLLLMPSFINILMVYAFCNIHDVSWGTKGDNNIPADVAPIITNTGPTGGNPVCITDLPTNQSDIDELYEKLLQDLSTKPANSFGGWFSKRAPASREDFFKLFRTRVVLAWLSSNALLIMVMTTPEIAGLIGVSEESANNPYVVVILWSVAVLSILRFIGSCIYLVLP
ncbi:Chitin synthase, class 1 [Chytriomyces hyalinus]|nr:Chitin synthase, class 1 [Chytriomyces hyalinus]